LSNIPFEEHLWLVRYLEIDEETSINSPFIRSGKRQEDQILGSTVYASRLKTIFDNDLVTGLTI